ncbi:MAG: major capsid protein [Flavobacterium sp.]
MTPSLYSGVISQDIFNRLILSIVQKHTDPEATMPYLHQTLLDKEYSVNGTFASISELVTNFMVDVVATDSKLPLKNREKVALLNGFLPKMGNKMYFNEQQLQDLDAMVAMTGMPLTELLTKLFKDADTLIKGGLLRNEFLFLQALSKGKASVTDADNVGVSFECDYQFENRGYASTAWSGAGATPYTDLANRVADAMNKGIVLTKAFMTYKTFTKLMNSAEVKGMFAGINQLISRRSLEEILLSELGLTVHVVNRTVTSQINGVNKTVQAWAEGQITLTTDDKLGKLVWTRTAEFNHRVGGVMYTDADGGVFLVSKYGKNDPVAEFTAIQGRCLPVLSNVQNIYTLDTTKTSA